PRHADPAALPHAPREVAVEPAPGARALRPAVLGQLLLEEGADLVTQRLRLGRKRGQLEVECRHDGLLNLPEQGSRDDHAMYFRRPLADAPHAGLAIPALQRELLGHPVAAMDLDGRVDHAAPDPA